MSFADPEGQTGDWDTHTLENHKATKPAFNIGPLSVRHGKKTLKWRLIAYF